MRFLKHFTRAALALVAAGTLLTGCSDPTNLEPYYSETLTNALNSQPLRPNWDGPAPLFYLNDGFVDGSCAISAGVGKPYAAYGKEEVTYIIAGAPTGYHCAHVGYESVAVVYDPKTRKFRGYQWKASKDSLSSREALTDAAVGDMYVYALDVMMGAVSQKPWKLSGGISAAQTSRPDAIHPVPEFWSKPKAIALMNRINESYR